MSVSILIDKSARRLRAYAQGRCVLDCCVALGFGASDGPKRREGDGRTPEGRYFVCTKNAASRYHLALGISYPNASDARAAFERGEIDENTCSAIARAAAEKRRPDWQTPLGGYIMIHGEGAQARAGDWTAGCVALANRQMEKLFALAQPGDEVVIRP